MNDSFFYFIKNKIIDFSDELINDFEKSHNKTRRKSNVIKIYKKYEPYFNLKTIKQIDLLIKNKEQSLEELFFIKSFLIEYTVDFALRTKITFNELNKFSISIGFNSYLDLINYTNNSNLNFYKLSNELLKITDNHYNKLYSKLIKSSSKNNITRELLNKSTFNKTPALNTIKLICSQLDIKKINLEENDTFSFISQKDNNKNIVFNYKSNSNNLLDQSGIYHELGHAVYLLNNSKKLSILFKRLGSSEVNESIAFLFQDLFESTLNETNKLILEFYRLFILRRSCLRYLIQHNFYSGMTNDSKLFIKFLGVKKEPLIDSLSDNFVSLTFIKAELIHCAIKKYLTTDKEKEFTFSDFKRNKEILFKIMSLGNKLNFNNFESKTGIKFDKHIIAEAYCGS